MLIKVYIKKNMFHLPGKQDKLSEQIEITLNKKIDRAKFSKLYPIDAVDHENILIEKQHTNIFLLNLLLLVLNQNKKSITRSEYYNDSFIVSSLEEETGLNLKGVPFETLEVEINNYLNPQKIKIEEKEGEKESFLNNIEFSLDWLKKAQKELNRREE